MEETFSLSSSSPTVAVLLRKLSHLLGVCSEDAGGSPGLALQVGLRRAVLCMEAPQPPSLSQDGRIPHPHPAPGCCVLLGSAEAGVTDRATYVEEVSTRYRPKTQPAACLSSVVQAEATILGLQVHSSGSGSACQAVSERRRGGLYCCDVYLLV